MLRRIRRMTDALRGRFLSPSARCDLFRSQGARIGQGTRLLVHSLGAEPFLVEIGDHTLVSFEVLFLTHDGGHFVAELECPTANRFGRIKVGSNVFIGARAIIMPGVTIGDDCVIGAGSVVTHDVPSGSVAAGVPARVITSTEAYRSKVIAESLPLSPELFPLGKADRGALREELDRLL